MPWLAPSFDSCPDEFRGPVTEPLAAIKGRNPDPSQRGPDWFRLPPRALAEHLDERVGIESIERNGERAGIEVRDQALFLVGFDAGSQTAKS